jgi:hypothetical protein
MDPNTAPPTTDTASEQLISDQSPKFDIQTFEATRSVVSRQVQHLQKLKNEIKQQNQQLKNLLENDQNLNIAQTEAKEVAQKAKVRKTELLETSEAKKIKLRISDLKDEQTDLEDSLTNHLLDLYQATGVMEFEDTEGHIWEYNLKAKLKSRNS